MWDIHEGDCLDVMQTFGDCTFDTLICDPPSGTHFMSRAWDNHSRYEARSDKAARTQDALLTLGIEPWEAGFVAFTVDWASAALRVLKPGAMGLVWALPRTSDLTGLGLRLAGFEVRDNVYHIFGSGFPKSASISKNIDKAAGAEREVVGEKIYADGKPRSTGANETMHEGWQRPWRIEDPQRGERLTAPATDAAKLWDGWGTALKPAAEEWLLIMRPLDGTFAHNAVTHGVAGLWVDGARVGYSNGETPESVNKSSGISGGIFGNGKPTRMETRGRWPANVILSDDAEVTRLFPVTSSGSIERTGSRANKDSGWGMGHTTTWEGDTGSAARFFYCAKSSTSERSAGLEGDKNTHPTCKPLSLLRYLTRLTRTPTGGVVLDPFAGSGTTGAACALEGRAFVGIEREAEYVEIARRRITYWAAQAEKEALQPELFAEAAD